MPADDDSLQRLERRIAVLEQELAAARMSLRRASVQQALLDERLLLLERNRLFRWWNQAYRAAARLYARVGPSQRYGGLTDLRTPHDYARWVSHEQHEMAREDHRGTALQWPSQPLISVLLTGGAAADCRASLQSLFEQCYCNWELCLAADNRSLREEIEGGYQIAPARIIEDAEDAAAASGDFLLELHPGDRLSPHALYFYAQALRQDALQQGPADLLYADEDTLDSSGHRTEPLFKPGWSPELLSTAMYLGRAVLYRRQLYLQHQAATPWERAQRCAESGARVRHIPRVLYHRAKSAPLEKQVRHWQAPSGSRLSLIICSRQVGQVRECLDAVKATATLPLEIVLVHHLESGSGEEMRRLVEGFSGTSLPYRGPFDFARMNNIGAANATAPYLAFLNDDVIVKQPGWDQALAATVARPEIGIAGAVLQYPDGALQHAGVVSGMGDAVGHCGRFQMTSELWPWLCMSRDVSAVTGAMLAMRSALFHDLGGFDEAFPVNYNDVDLCFRVREAGLRVVCLNVGEVIHRESQTRIGGTRHDEREALYKRWANVLGRPDEFYSPHLAPTERIALRTAGQHPLEALGS